MPSNARQRTAGQRKTKDKAEEKEEAPVQTTEEQEVDIKALRKRNQADNERSQNILDTGILIILFIVGSEFLRQLETPGPLLILTGLQVALLPFSVTPHWLPLFRPITENYHPYIAFVHLGVFVLSLMVMRQGPWTSSDMVRWALPELIAGAVEIQRRGERESERNLVRLEDLKYDVKGA